MENRLAPALSEARDGGNVVGDTCSQDQPLGEVLLAARAHSEAAGNCSCCRRSAVNPTDGRVREDLLLPFRRDDRRRLAVEAKHSVGPGYEAVPTLISVDDKNASPGASELHGCCEPGVAPSYDDDVIHGGWLLAQDGLRRPPTGVHASGVAVAIVTNSRRVTQRTRGVVMTRGSALPSGGGR